MTTSIFGCRMNLRKFTLTAVVALAVSASGQTSPGCRLACKADEYAEAAIWAGEGNTDSGRILTSRQQAIVAIGACAGRGDLPRLEEALAKGLEASMTVNEIKEILVQGYAYAGFPRSLRALQTFMSLLEKREAAGIEDSLGRESTPVPSMDDVEKYSLGRMNLAELSGVPADAPAAGYAVFAPVIEKYLKEHLFADIFSRDLLSWQERELATVSILAGVGGVEPMAASHMRICLRQGITTMQLGSLVDIVECWLGASYSNPLRPVVEALGEEKR